MGFDELNERQLVDRMRHLSDSIDTMWNKISPLLKEFDLLNEEYYAIIGELSEREVKKHGESQ